MRTGPAPTARPAEQRTTEGGWRRKILLSLIAILAVMGVMFGVRLWNADSHVLPPKIVILAASVSNGEQLVTFRPDPPNAEVTYVDLVSGAYDGSHQPKTMGRFGRVIPTLRGDQTNFTLHFIAVPLPAASLAGTPLPYTPGGYTVAYVPSENAHRLRIGVARQQSGIAGYTGWLRECWNRKSINWPVRNSYGRPFFVTTGPFTNAVSHGP